MSFAVCHKEKTQNRLSLLKKAQAANGLMDKSIEQEREKKISTDRVSRALTFSTGLQAIINFVVPNALS